MNQMQYYLFFRGLSYKVYRMHNFIITITNTTFTTSFFKKNIQL